MEEICLNDKRFKVTTDLSETLNASFDTECFQAIFLTPKEVPFYGKPDIRWTEDRTLE